MKIKHDLYIINVTQIAVIYFMKSELVGNKYQEEYNRKPVFLGINLSRVRPAIT